MSPKRAFSLVELVIAMGIGVLVALGAYTAFRTAAQTIAVVNRMSLENRLMRTGIDQALDEADFWTSYDDPDQPTGQALRMTASRNTLYEQNVQEGGPFSRLHQTPVYRDWDLLNPETPIGYAPVGWELRPADPLLESPSDLRDPLRLQDRDGDRGWDARRPYVAADPRGWYRGNLAEEGRSDKRAGRYAMRSNKRRFPWLGYGADPREVGGWNRDPSLAAQVSTGPFGQLTSGDALPFTWRDQQITLLHQAMGYYGMMDYLPSNAVYGSYGAWMLGQEPLSGSALTNGWPVSHTSEPPLAAAGGGIYVRNDERLDFRYSPYPAENIRGNSFAQTSPISPPRGGGHAGNRLGSGATVSTYRSGGTYPLLPRSRYTGIFNISVSRDTTGWNDGFLGHRYDLLRPEFAFYSDYADNAVSTNIALSNDKWLEMLRYRWPGEQDQPYHLSQLWQRATMLRPVARQRPHSWPELHVSQARLMYRARFMHLCSVRWTDNQTAEAVELRFSTIGTTLRGARQQRHRGQGWADWHGVDSPLNDPTLDDPP